MLYSDNSEAKILSEAEVSLRPLRWEDRDALVDLWVAAWRDTMPEIDFEARRGWIVAFLTDPTHATTMALVGGRAVGFISMEGRYLHQLVVAPAAKGRGIATRLLDAAKADGALTLDVNQANARAVRFYEREGFFRAGAGRNPGSGLATWTMRWP